MHCVRTCLLPDQAGTANSCQDSAEQHVFAVLKPAYLDNVTAVLIAAMFQVSKPKTTRCHAEYTSTCPPG